MTNIQWRRLADALEDNGGNEGGQDDYYDDAMDSQLLTSRGKEVRACTETEGQNLSTFTWQRVHACLAETHGKAGLCRTRQMRGIKRTMSYPGYGSCDAVLRLSGHG